ncbi:MAG: pantetheine-phosphate adenylyltransferase [Candidatus Margulisbacteria bacterium GWF2_35_9]|nr:MAG: pantetheine-phosphate adenylyltransferase [Candidatus Margulisbacteria bacterium GWF2_35_9]
MTKIAVYPGSFDPVTNGHISIIKRALRVFDHLIVAVSQSDPKKPFFTIEERCDFIKSLDLKNVIVKPFDGLLVNFCKTENVQVMVRGLRAVSDFDYEFQLALANRRMDRDIETIFLMTDYKYSYLSSSLIKDMAKFKGNIEGLVPVHVNKALQERFS